MIISETADSYGYLNLPSHASPEIIDPDSGLKLDHQAQLFKIFTGINLHYLYNDLVKCIQPGKIHYCESDIFRIRPEALLLWNLVESNIEDVINYARFCIDQTNYFPPFSRQRFTDEQ